MKPVLKVDPPRYNNGTMKLVYDNHCFLCHRFVYDDDISRHEYWHNNFEISSFYGTKLTARSEMEARILTMFIISE